MEAPNETPLDTDINNNTENNPGAFNCSLEDLDKLKKKMDAEVQQLFPVGSIHPSPQAIRDAAGELGNRHLFAVSTEGFSVLCSRASEPSGAVKKRTKKTPVPLAKQRTRFTTRCGCSFAVKFTPVSRKEKEDKRVRITVCDGMRSSGCMPSKVQLRVEKRKAGAATRAINEHQIKAIASVLNTGTKIHLWLIAGSAGSRSIKREGAR